MQKHERKCLRKVAKRAGLINNLTLNSLIDRKPVTDLAKGLLKVTLMNTAESDVERAIIMAQLS